MLTLPAVAEKTAELTPEATVTLPGTLTALLLLESATTVFPEAALLRATVQFDVAPLATVDGLQLSELTCADALAASEVDTVPLLPET